MTSVMARRVLFGQLLAALALSPTVLAQARRARVGFLSLGPLAKVDARTLSESLLLAALRVNGWREPGNLVLESRGPAGRELSPRRRQSWSRSGPTFWCRPARRRSGPCAT